jgi:hypothetical protein
MDNEQPRIMHDHLHLVNGQWVEDEPRTLYTSVQQQIEAEEHFPSYPPHAQEDFMYDRVYELAGEGLIDVIEAHNIFANWITRRRPATTVIKVKPDPIPGLWRMYE